MTFLEKSRVDVCDFLSLHARKAKNIFSLGVQGVCLRRFQNKPFKTVQLIYYTTPARGGIEILANAPVLRRLIGDAYAISFAYF